MDKRGIKYDYEYEKLPYTLRLWYTPDLTITNNKCIIEIKGYFDYESQRKMLAVKKDNPTHNIKILFARDKPIRKGSKLTYSGWAKKHGYPYAIGETIPEEWLT